MAPALLLLFIFYANYGRSNILLHLCRKKLCPHSRTIFSLRIAHNQIKAMSTPSNVHCDQWEEGCSRRTCITRLTEINSDLPNGLKQLTYFFTYMQPTDQGHIDILNLEASAYQDIIVFDIEDSYNIAMSTFVLLYRAPNNNDSSQRGAGNSDNYRNRTSVRDRRNFSWN